MSRSEAASLAGKASAAARRAKAGGGSGQTTDAAAAERKAKALIAANPRKYGAKTAGSKKGAGKGKAAKKVDPAAAKAKAEKENQAKEEKAARVKEHEERQKEHEADRTQRQADHDRQLKEHLEDRAQRQADRQAKMKQAQEKQKAAQQKAKAKSGGKSGSGSKKPGALTAAVKPGEKGKGWTAAKFENAPAAAPAQAAASSAPAAPAQSAAPPSQSPPPATPPPRKGRAVPPPTTRKAVGAEQDALTKAETSSMNWTGWAEITKVDEEKRIVYGIASTEKPDDEPGIWKGQAYAGDIISSDAIRDAAPEYLEFPAIREMHQPIAAGTAVHFEVEGDKTFVGAHVVDDQAWKKVVEKVYRGFSIGGKCLDAEIVKLVGRPYRRVTKLKLNEISLVDRPRNTESKFTLYKGADMDSENTSETVAAEAQDSTTINKAADPAKAIAMLQQLRNDAEVEGDMDAADGYTQAIRQVSEAAGLSTPSSSTGDEADMVADDSSDLDMGDLNDDEEDEDGVAMSQVANDLRKRNPGKNDDQIIELLLKRITSTSISKRGAALSAANLSHAKTAHDALAKMTGGAVCADNKTPQQAAGIMMGEGIAPGDIAKALMPAFDQISKLLEAQGSQMTALADRVAKVEAQPAAHAPAARLVPVEKSIAGTGSDPAPKDERIAQLDILKKSREKATNPAVIQHLSEEITTLSIALGYRGIA